MKTFLYWGTEPHNNIRLNQKIILSNLVTFILFVLNIPFVIINYLYFPNLFLFSTVFIFLNFLTLLLNRKRWQAWGRMTLAGVYPCVYLIYHAYLIPQNQHFLVFPYLIQVGLWLPAFLVYDFQEKKQLIGLVVLFIASAFLLPFLNNWLEMPNNLQTLLNGELADTLLVMVTIGIFSCVIAIKYLNHKVEYQNEKLLVTLAEKQKALDKSLEELEEEHKEVNFMMEKNKSSEAILKKAMDNLQKQREEVARKNNLLEEKEHEIEAQNEELKQQQEELKTVNDHLTHQNEEITKQKKLIEAQKLRAEILVKSLEKEISKQTYRLQTMLDDMTKQNEDLKQFSYIISHNIRSPIAHLLGLVSIFDKQDMNNPFNQEVLSRIEDSSKNLDSIIRDLTQIIAIRNNLNKAKESVNIRELVDFEKDLLHEEIEIANVTLLEEIEENIHLFSIKSYIQSILHNLLSNAIKYRNSRRQLEIVLKIGIENKFLQIIVQDNGLGMEMSETTKEKIFGLYQRMHDHVEGKGLGLYMVKNQVKALGGKIEVESELNKGTTFKVLLPLQK